MTEELDYLHHLRVESARFAEVLRDTPSGAPVPTCPDWTADDLLWHLGEVQHFWAGIVREAVTDPADLEEPERPEDRAELRAFYRAASAELQRTLAATDPGALRWTWSTEQSAGFTRRRQAHEALIHRLDAELTAGSDRSGIDPAFAGDGVDEVLRIIFGGCPPWGQIDPEAGTTVRVAATDIARTWLITLGRFTGTDPEGVAHDEADLVVADTDSGVDAKATFTGTAADLDCFLWGRPPLVAIDRTGNEDVLAGFETIIGQGVD